MDADADGPFSQTFPGAFPVHPVGLIQHGQRHQHHGQCMLRMFFGQSRRAHVGVPDGLDLLDAESIGEPVEGPEEPVQVAHQARVPQLGTEPGEALEVAEQHRARRVAVRLGLAVLAQFQRRALREDVQQQTFAAVLFLGQFARALAYHALQPFPVAPELARAQLHEAEDQQDACATRGRLESRGAPDRGFHGEAEAEGLLVPDPARIACDHLEGVLPGLQVAVRHAVLFRDGGPVRIVAVQEVLVADLLRVGQRHAHEGEGQLVLVVRKHQSAGKSLGVHAIAPRAPVHFLVEELKPRQPGAGLVRVAEHVVGLVAGEALHGAEPQRAVQRVQEACVPEGLHTGKAFLGPVVVDVDHVLLEFVEHHVVEPQTCADPQVLHLVQQHLFHIGVAQSLGGTHASGQGQGIESRSPQAEEAMPLTATPQIAHAIAHQGSVGVGRRHGDRHRFPRHTPGVQVQEAGRGGDPDRISGRCHRVHGCRQRHAHHLSVTRRTQEPIAGARPDAALPVGDQEVGAAIAGPARAQVHEPVVAEHEGPFMLGAHDHPARAVAGQGKHEGVHQPFVGSVPGKHLAVEMGHATSVGADPDIAVAGALHGAHDARPKTIAIGEVDEGQAHELARAAILRADPHGPGTVLVEGADVVVAKSVACGEGAGIGQVVQPAFQHHQAHRGADPDGTMPAAQQALHPVRGQHVGGVQAVCQAIFQDPGTHSGSHHQTGAVGEHGGGLRAGGDGQQPGATFLVQHDPLVRGGPDGGAHPGHAVHAQTGQLRDGLPGSGFGRCGAPGAHGPAGDPQPVLGIHQHAGDLGVAKRLGAGLHEAALVPPHHAASEPDPQGA